MTAGVRRARFALIAAAPAVLVLVGLGAWQLQRLQWKTELLATIQQQMAAPPLDLAAIDLGRLDELAWRRVTLTGAFDHDKEMILLARTRNKQAGAHVITPFRADDGRWLLVNRGWVPRAYEDPARRAQGQIAGTVSLDGVTRVPPQPGGFTPDNVPGQWYWIDIPAMAAAAGVALLPFIVEAGSNQNPGGLPIGGQTRVDIPNDHLGYAFTWFSLAAILIVIAALFYRRETRGAP